MTPQAHHPAAAVEEMLLDAGLGHEAGLRRALLALGSLADQPVPAPSGQLAVLLGVPPREAPLDGNRPGSDVAGSKAVDELGRRRRRAHRPTVVGLALVAGMGMGVGTVAASSAGPAHTGSPSVQQLLENWTPAWTMHSSQASPPWFLRGVIGDGGDAGDQGGNSPAGREGTLTGAPEATFPSQPSPAPAPDAPGQGRNEGGEPPSANRQVGTKEPEERGSADSSSSVPGPVQPARPDSGNGSPPAAGVKSGDGAAPASGLRTESGQGAGAQNAGAQGAGQGAVAAAGPNPVPGAKWLEKFGR
jgi:hypothetical protein